MASDTTTAGAALVIGGALTMQAAVMLEDWGFSMDPGLFAFRLIQAGIVVMVIGVTASAFFTYKKHFEE